MIEADQMTPGPHLVRVTCPACGYSGFVSGRLRLNREIVCSSCMRPAILGDVRTDRVEA
jgi:hypothetical protein